MFLSVKQAAQTLQMELHQVYYLLTMGEIEAIRVNGRGKSKNKTWSLSADAVNKYVELHPKRKITKSTGYFIYSGDNGCLFSIAQDYSPSDENKNTACVEGRRGQLVCSAKRSDKILLSKLKSIAQLELFSA